MPDEVVSTPEAPVETPAQPDFNVQLAQAMWTPEQVAPAAASPEAPAPIAEAPVIPEAPQEEIIDDLVYLKQQVGYEDWTVLKSDIDELKKLRETAQTPAEIKFANEQSQKFFDLLKEGKNDDVYNYLHQQRQIERLEKLTIANTSEAAEIIKAGYQYKHPNLTSDEIDFIVEQKYAKPPKPIQGDLEDADYQIQLSNWEQHVGRIDKQMTIDAKLEQPGIAQYKSTLVLPDIPKVDAQPQPDQKALEAQQAFHQNFIQKLGSDYQNFKGFSVTAKDGEVELPISYTINPDELNASKQMLENLNVNEFLDKRWFNEQGIPNITQMQEDLYLLTNRDKVFQKIANEAAAQRFLHHQKIQNNIKLNGVTTPTAPVPTTDTKAEQQQLAEFVWKM